MPAGSTMRRPSMKPTQTRPAKMVPVMLPMPPDDDDDEEVYGFEEIEIGRVEKGIEVGVEAAGDARRGSSRK